MNFPIIIQGGEIIFSYSPMKRSGIRTFYTLLSWMSDYGLIIPLDHYSWIIKVALTDNRVDADDFTVPRALLLDIDGLIKEIAIYNNTGDIKIATSFVDYSEGVKYVRSESMEHEEHITALFSINFSNDEILDFIDKNSLIDNTSVCRYPISVLQDLVKEKCINPKKYHSSLLLKP